MRTLLALALFLFTTYSNADVSLCSIKTSAAYTDPPVAGKPLPKVASMIAPNSSYSVIKESPGWVLIQVDTRKLWAERKYFDVAQKCQNGTGKVLKGSSKPASTLSTTKHMPATPPNSSCSCSSNQVCRGPRGGRYCIAPNGAKRYGV